MTFGPQEALRHFEAESSFRAALLLAVDDTGTILS
jgi:hypothetical protein